MYLRRLFIVVLFCCQVLCSKKICDTKNSECLTRAAKRVGFTTKSLHVDTIEADLTTVKYTLNNVTLSGIKNCSPDLVKINSNSKTYDYHIACKHLTMTGLYEIKGRLGPMPVEGTGDFQVDYYDYRFLFDGEYEQTVDQDMKSHNHIKNFNLDIEVKGDVIYNFNNLFNGDKEKAAALHKYVVENGATVNKILRQPVMSKFMALHIEKVNEFMKEVAFEDIFTED